jgi:phage terminase Nu1 subunit (DNA packaging protein)
VAGKREELEAALQATERKAAELRKVLGLPKRDHTVDSQAEVAEFFGVSLHTVNSWRKQQVPLPGKSGRNNQAGEYDLKACFDWYIVHGPGRRKGRVSDEYDPLMDVEDNTPALERWRMARAKSAELDLAERQGQIVSVQLFQEVMQAAFIPLRRFAESQIKEHGNGTADAWAEAVDLFEKEVEGVVGKSRDSSGEDGVSGPVEPVSSPSTDTDR